MPFPIAAPLALTAPALAASLQPQGADWTPEYGDARKRWLAALEADRAALAERAAPFIAALTAARPIVHGIVEGLDATSEGEFLEHVRQLGPRSHEIEPAGIICRTAWDGGEEDAGWVMAHLPLSGPQYDRTGPHPVERPVDREEIAARRSLQRLLTAVFRNARRTPRPMGSRTPVAPGRFEPRWRWAVEHGHSFAPRREEVLALILGN